MTAPKRRPGTKRRGPMLATILRACMEPTDSVTLAQKLGLGRNAVMLIMRQLYALRLVHIGGWTESAWSKPPAVKWMIGEGEDAQRPRGKWRGVDYQPRQCQPHIRKRMSADMVAFAHAIRAMNERPVTAEQIEELTGWAHTTVARFIVHCRRIGLVYIADWSRTAKNCGVWARMYQVGDEADAPKPRAIPRSVVEQRSRLARRQRATDLRMAHALAANAEPFKQPQAA